MKRHISIFAFLLGAFAVTAQAGNLAVSGGYYYIEGFYKGRSATYMSVEGGGMGKTGLNEGDEVTFYAHPGKGLLMKEWGVCWGNSGGANIWHYAALQEKIASNETNYTWKVVADRDPGYLAVNFKYILFDITFDRNGADGGAPAMNPLEDWTIDTPETQLPPCAFTRTGYEMAGWSNAVYWAAHQPPVIDNGGKVKGEDFWDDAKGEFGEGNKVTLTALWEPNTYTVHFEGNGATSGSMNDQTFTYDEDAKELSANAFTKENHVFAGWATNETLGVVVYQDKQKVRNLTAEKDGTVNLYARWTPMHKVTFKEHAMFDGKVLKEEYVVDGKDATPPDVPQHPGLSFKGWEGTYTSVTSDRTITAKYEGTEGAVWYHANDGTDVKAYQDFKHGVETTLLSANTFSRTGYTLGGWMTNAASTAADYACGAKLMIPLEIDVFNLYAFWSPISYTVAFDGNGATEGSMEPIPLDYGVPFEVPACKFKKAGCEFKSWQVLINKVVVTNYPAGVTVSNLTSKAGDTVTFKADWIGRYTVAFNGNGGEGEMTNVTYESGVEYALPSNAFAKTGYGFYGWAKSKADADALKKPAYTNGQTVVDLADPGETRMLFAEWTTNRYTVVFNPNGGTGTMANQPFVYDQSQRLRESTFKRGELWSFAGWTNSAAGGLFYTNREEVVNLCAEDGGVVTLDAVWTSDVGELSEAMGCDNLKWVSDKVWERGENLDAWEVCTTNGFGGSCAQLVHKGSTADLSTMHANIGTNGTLTFKWQPVSESDKFSVVVVGEKNPEYYCDVIFKAETIGGWSEAKVPVPEFVDGETGVQIKISLVIGSTCFVDQMTWTPDGAHPEPVDGKDNVTISSAAVSADGKSFSLSFKSDAQFDYNLLTNANLLITEGWGVMEKKTGTGEPITFEPEIIEGQPQMFYRVDTIQRKD